MRNKLHFKEYPHPLILYSTLWFHENLKQFWEATDGKMDTATTTQNYSAQLHSKVRGRKVSNGKKKKPSEPSTFWYLFLRVKQPGGKWKNSPSTIHRNSFKSHVRSGVNNHPMHRCICHFSSVCPLAASVSGCDKPVAQGSSWVALCMYTYVTSELCTSFTVMNKRCPGYPQV